MVFSFASKGFSKPNFSNRDSILQLVPWSFNSKTYHHQHQDPPWSHILQDPPPSQSFSFGPSPPQYKRTWISRLDLFPFFFFFFFSTIHHNFSIMSSIANNLLGDTTSYTGSLASSYYAALNSFYGQPDVASALSAVRTLTSDTSA